jgi:predicted solute-binding protein
MSVCVGVQHIETHRSNNTELLEGKISVARVKSVLYAPPAQLQSQHLSICSEKLKEKLTMHNMFHSNRVRLSASPEAVAEHRRVGVGVEGS